jgi:hypothetical protein
LFTYTELTDHSINALDFLAEADNRLNIRSVKREPPSIKPSFDRSKELGGDGTPTDIITDPQTGEEWPALTLQVKLFQEFNQAFVGFMPIRTFLESFLPWQQRAARIPSQDDSFPACTKVSEETYEPFVSQKSLSAFSFFIKSNRLRQRVRLVQKRYNSPTHILHSTVNLFTMVLDQTWLSTREVGILRA